MGSGVVIWSVYKNKSPNRIFFILFASGKNYGVVWRIELFLIKK